MSNLNDMDVPKTPGNYLKLEEGTVKVRILSDFIDGYLDRDGKKPIRYHKDDCPEKAVGENGFVYFWDCVIWNYDLSRIQVREIKSKVIMAKIKALAADDDRGSDLLFDIKITKTGKDKNTKYDCIPANKGEVKTEILQAFLDASVDLSKLYKGENAFPENK